MSPGVPGGDSVGGIEGEDGADAGGRGCGDGGRCWPW